MSTTTTNEQILEAIHNVNMTVVQNGKKLETVYTGLCELKADVLEISNLPQRMKYAIEQMPTMTILPKDLARALGDTRSQKNLHQFIRRYAHGNKHGNAALWMHGKAGRSACVWSLQHGDARPTDQARYEDVTDCLHKEETGAVMEDDDALENSKSECQTELKKALLSRRHAIESSDDDTETVKTVHTNTDDDAEASRKRKRQKAEQEQKEQALMIEQEQAVYTSAQQKLVRAALELLIVIIGATDKAKANITSPQFNGLVKRDKQHVPTPRFASIQVELEKSNAPVEAVRFAKDLHEATKAVLPVQRWVKAQFKDGVPVGYTSTFDHLVYLPYVPNSKEDAAREMGELEAHLCTLRLQYAAFTDHVLGAQ